MCSNGFGIRSSRITPLETEHFKRSAVAVKAGPGGVASRKDALYTLPQ